MFRAPTVGQTTRQSELGLGRPPYSALLQARTQLNVRESEDGRTTTYCSEDTKSHYVKLDGHYYDIHASVIRAVPEVCQMWADSYNEWSETYKVGLPSTTLNYILPQLYGPQLDLPTPWAKKEIWEIITFTAWFKFGLTLDQYARELAQMLFDGIHLEDDLFAVHAWIYLHSVELGQPLAAKIAEGRLVDLVKRKQVRVDGVEKWVEDAVDLCIPLNRELEEALNRVRDAGRCSDRERLEDADADDDRSEAGTIIDNESDEDEQTKESPISSAGEFCELPRGPSPEAVDGKASTRMSDQ